MITVTTNAARIAQDVGDLKTRIFENTRTGLKDCARRYRAYHRKERMTRKGATVGIRSGRTAQTGEGGTVLANTGVAGHFKYEAYGTSLKDLHVDLGTRSRVAIEHEQGGQIFPRGRKYMVLPMPIAQTRFGGTTKAAKRLLAQSKAQMGYQSASSGGFSFNPKLGKTRNPLFPIRVRGRSFLAQQVRSASRSPMQAGAYGLVRKKSAYEGFRTRLKFWFHLRRSTRLRPRLQFIDLFGGWAEANFMRIMSRVILYGERKKAAS